jgi:hypothetical protein
LDFSSFTDNTWQSTHYQLFWKFNDERTRITLGFNVSTLGNEVKFIGFGITEQNSGGMAGADILGIESVNSTIFLKDYFAYALEKPVLDACLSWELIDAANFVDPLNPSRRITQVIATRDSAVIDTQDRSFEVLLAFQHRSYGL